MKSSPDLQKNTSFIRCGKEVSTTAQLYSTKPELRFSAVSNPARGVSEICDGNGNGPGWKLGLTHFVGQPFCKNNSVLSYRAPLDDKFSIYIGFTESKLTLNFGFTKIVTAMKKTYVS